MCNSPLGDFCGVLAKITFLLPSSPGSLQYTSILAQVFLSRAQKSQITLLQCGLYAVGKWILSESLGLSALFLGVHQYSYPREEQAPGMVGQDRCSALRRIRIP